MNSQIPINCSLVGAAQPGLKAEVHSAIILTILLANMSWPATVVMHFAVLVFIGCLQSFDLDALPFLAERRECRASVECPTFTRYSHKKPESNPTCERKSVIILLMFYCKLQATSRKL